MHKMSHLAFFFPHLFFLGKRQAPCLIVSDVVSDIFCQYMLLMLRYFLQKFAFILNVSSGVYVMHLYFRLSLDSRCLQRYRKIYTELSISCFLFSTILITFWLKQLRQTIIFLDKNYVVLINFLSIFLFFFW